MAATHTVQDALSEMLSSLGYGQMARDVKTERDKATLRRYAAFIVRQLNRQGKRELAKQAQERFYRLRRLGEL